MKITIVVLGRFYAFDIGRALAQLDHEVSILTNHPPFKYNQFGLEDSEVKTFWLY